MAELHEANAVIDDRTGEEETLQVIRPAMARRHPFQFAGCVLLVVVGAGGGIFAASQGMTIAAIAGGVATVAGLGMLGVWYLRILNTTLTITTRRSILRHGIIARSTSEVRHNDVRNLQVHQSVVERILGVGDVEISSAGQSDVEIRVEGIPEPDGVAERIRSLQTE